MEPGKWKEGTPQDNVAKGQWWALYEDSKLNELEERASQNNQNLKAAVARVDQARAISRIARAQFMPTLDLDGGGSFSRSSANRPIPNSTHQAFTTSDTQLALDLGYEIDIWGRVRRQYEAARAEVQVSEAEFLTIRLTLHADVAQNYFSLRASDSEIAILRDTIEIRRKALELIRTRFNGGISSDLDVAQAETLLANAESELASVQKRRAELAHALAVLLGATPESFALTENPLRGLPPIVPAGLPSDLLERRPDVARVERAMAAANANIGVAQAAFYPRVQLSGAAGFESVNLGSLFDWPSRLWAIGPSFTLPIFEGGRNTANLSRAEAAYLETVANYRGQVLQAFREVEDGLSGLHYLVRQAEALDRAVASSQRAFDISNRRYTDGLVTYLDVVDSQRVALENRRAAVQNLAQRFVTHVLLIKALGGGWAQRDAGLTNAAP